MITTFTSASLLLRIVPWTITAGLLGVWGYAVATSNALAGFANGFLIAGAVMVLVSLYLGRRTISQSLPTEQGLTP
jgi:hypothetical protein